RSPRAGLTVGAAGVAAGRENAARARGDHGTSINRVGQEDHAKADGLHDDDQVFGSDRAQSGIPTPTRAAAVADPTAIPRGAGHPRHVFHSAPKWLRRRRGPAQEPEAPGGQRWTGPTEGERPGWERTAACRSL